MREMRYQKEGLNWFNVFCFIFIILSSYVCVDGISQNDSDLSKEKKRNTISFFYLTFYVAFLFAQLVILNTILLRKGKCKWSSKFITPNLKSNHIDR